MLEWLKLSVKSGTGVSLSRQLMLMMIAAVSFSLVYEAVKRGIGAPWSVVATGVVGSLATIWGVSKWRGNAGSGGSSGGGTGK